jgi:hypothetical protein
MIVADNVRDDDCGIKDIGIATQDCAYELHQRFSPNHEPLD